MHGEKVLRWQQTSQEFATGPQASVHPEPSCHLRVIRRCLCASGTEPTGPGPQPTGATTPEAPTGELVASLGVAKYVIPSLRLALGLSVDNNGAVLVRPGFTIRRR